MLDGMTEQLVQITVDGKAIHVAPANTVIQALALSGEPLLDNVGCMGQGVCGSCRCMVRRLGSREVNTELACETLVEDGMQVSFIDYFTPRRPTCWCSTERYFSRSKALPSLQRLR